MVFFPDRQSDVVFIKFQTFHVAVVGKGCFTVHLFGNAPIYVIVQAPFWSAAVAESTVM